VRKVFTLQHLKCCEKSQFTTPTGLFSLKPYFEAGKAILDAKYLARKEASCYFFRDKSFEK